MATTLAKLPRFGPSQPEEQEPPQLSPVFMQENQNAPLARLPQTPQPTVVQPTDQERNLDYHQQELQKVREAEAQPWGSEAKPPSEAFPHGIPANHANTMGKIAHVLSVAANIGGNIVAPGVMANIPGTEMYNREKEAGLSQEVGKEQEAQTQQKLQGAQTQEFGTKASAEALTPATIAEAEAFGVPAGTPLNSASRAALAKQAGINQTKTETTGTTNQTKMTVAQLEAASREAVAQGKPQPHITSMVGGVPHIMERDPNTGQYSIDRGEAPPNFAMVAPGVTMVTPNTEGGGTVKRVMPGQTLDPGAINPTAFSSMNVPTSSTRTMIETAPRVIDLANRVEQLIDPQVQSLGPAASRWAEFMAGKIGAPNPQFTALRTNVGLLSTALMRMHVGARGGEQIMQHFADLIDSSKQSPENLKAALQEIKQYAQQVSTEAGPGVGGIANQNEASKRGQEVQTPKVQQSPSTGEFRYSMDGGKTWHSGKPPQK